MVSGLHCNQHIFLSWVALKDEQVFVIKSGDFFQEFSIRLNGLLEPIREIARDWCKVQVGIDVGSRFYGVNYLIFSLAIFGDPRGNLLNVLTFLVRL